MIPLFVLLVSFAVFRIAGFAGVDALNHVDLPLRIALALMFFVTASAHWGKGKPDLVRMVPPIFPRPALLVTVTGILEILGAIGLLVPATARTSALSSAALLIALFPANVRAARLHLNILGRPAPGLLLRGVIQLIFLAALLLTAAHTR